MLVVTKKRKKIKKEKYDPFLAMTRLTDVSAIRVGGGKFGFTPSAYMDRSFCRQSRSLCSAGLIHQRFTTPRLTASSLSGFKISISMIDSWIMPIADRAQYHPWSWEHRVQDVLLRGGWGREVGGKCFTAGKPGDTFDLCFHGK